MFSFTTAVVAPKHVVNSGKGPTTKQTKAESMEALTCAFSQLPGRDIKRLDDRITSEKSILKLDLYSYLPLLPNFWQLATATTAKLPEYVHAHVLVKSQNFQNLAAPLSTCTFNQLQYGYRSLWRADIAAGSGGFCCCRGALSMNTLQVLPTEPKFGWQNFVV